MIGRHQRDALVLVEVAAQRADRGLGAQQGLGRELAQRDDGARPDDLELLAQEGLARRQLVGLRVAIAGRARARPLLVGFAAETPSAGSTGDARDAELVARARGKLERKRCDLVVANDVSTEGVGFGGDDSRLLVVSKDSVEILPAGSKAALAHGVWDHIAKVLP